MNFFSPIRHRHGERVDIDGILVRLRVDRRASRVSLRVDQRTREAIATAPTERALAEAVAFARRRRDWIETELSKLPASTMLEPGGLIDVLGAPCRLEATTGRAQIIPAEGSSPMRLLAKDDFRFADTVVRLLKAEARRVLVERTAYYAERLSQPMPVVAIMDAQGRWGSCLKARTAGFGAVHRVGRIRYSWRLVLMPYEVMDYVVAHEVAHLIEANHGENFWAIVKEQVGPVKAHRQWLRLHGPRIHAFGT